MSVMDIHVPTYSSVQMEAHTVATQSCKTGLTEGAIQFLLTIFSNIESWLKKLTHLQHNNDVSEKYVC